MERNVTNPIIDIGISVGQKIQSAHKDSGGKTREELLYKVVMWFFFLKAYRSLAAIGLLWRASYQEDAVTLARTVFEISLQSRYMRLEPSKRVKQYVAYETVVMYRRYRKLRRNYPDLAGVAGVAT